jgi:pyridine nucleotide-disulfide oxidoreductase family protein
MKRLLLIGAGHAHAQVLRDWREQPLPGVELTLVSPSLQAPYSGMVPGWLAGHYRFDQICIPVGALAAAAGAGFVRSELRRLDPQQRRVELCNGEALGYDLLSLNVGSTLTPPAPQGVVVLPLRPLGDLRQAWEQALAALQAQPSPARTLDSAGAASADRAPRPLRIIAVGGGAGGIEALLAVRHRLLRAAPQRKLQCLLVSRSTQLLAGAAPAAVRHIEAALQRAGVRVMLGQPYDDSMAAGCDLLLWAVGAQAHRWQLESGLALSEHGFIRIDAQLRCTSHPEVYAVGDCAEWPHPLPKAGVYAVRMGPVLSNNLRAALGDRPWRAYDPQPQALSLLAAGDRHAVASRGTWAAQGGWVWRWKDHLDRAFLRRFDGSVHSPQKR